MKRSSWALCGALMLALTSGCGGDPEGKGDPSGGEGGAPGHDGSGGAPGFVAPTFHPADDATVQATIDAEGGELVAVGPDGSEYKLVVPAHGLLEPTEISMTPLAGADDLPLSGGLLAGVQIEPRGLALLVPATLHVTPAAEADLPAWAFSHEAGEGTLQVRVSHEAEGTWRLAVPTFAEFGLGAGTEDEAASLERPTEVPRSAEQTLVLRLASEEPNEVSVRQALTTWFDAGVVPMFLPVPETDEALALVGSALHAWFAAVDLAAARFPSLGDQLADRREEGERLFGHGILTAIRRAKDACLEADDPALTGIALAWAERARDLGIDKPFEFDLLRLQPTLCFLVAIDSMQLAEEHLEEGTVYPLVVRAGRSMANEEGLRFDEAIDFRLQLEGAELVGSGSLEGPADAEGAFTIDLRPTGGVVVVDIEACYGAPDDPALDGVVCDSRRLVRNGVDVTPAVTTVQVGETQAFTATLTGVESQQVEWSTDGGSIDRHGVFTPTTTPGRYTVVARSSEGHGNVGMAEVEVVDERPTATVATALTSRSNVYSLDPDVPEYRCSDGMVKEADGSGYPVETSASQTCELGGIQFSGTSDNSASVTLDEMDDGSIQRWALEVSGAVHVAASGPGSDSLTAKSSTEALAFITVNRPVQATLTIRCEGDEHTSGSVHWSALDLPLECQGGQEAESVLSLEPGHHAVFLNYESEVSIPGEEQRTDSQAAGSFSAVLSFTEL